VHLATWLARTVPGLPQESLVRDETRISLPGQALPNPDDARPIVHRPMDLPVAAAVTEPGREPRVSGGTASTAMQCRRPLRHPGGP
jgi:hypothetical protein